MAVVFFTRLFKRHPPIPLEHEFIQETSDPTSLALSLGFADWLGGNHIDGSSTFGQATSHHLKMDLLRLVCPSIFGKQPTKKGLRLGMDRFLFGAG